MAERRFLLWLRQALQHLYDAPELRKSPLLALLGLDAHEGTQGLRDLLESGIEALKPPLGAGTQSDAWRNYYCLFRRYVQQFSQEEVAASLGISVRQAQRQAHSALETMADYLSAHYDVDGEQLPQIDERILVEDAGTSTDVVDEQPVVPGAASVPGAVGEPPSRAQELSWLERSSLNEPGAVAEVIDGVAKTLAPLQKSARAQVTYSVPDTAGAVAVARSALRQALLNLIPVALGTAANGQIRVEATASGEQVSVSVRWSPDEDSGAIDGLDIVSQLLVMVGGSLDIIARSADNEVEVCVRLPAFTQVPVLVIDDNPDALQLFSRYLEGTSYRFVSTHDPEQALGLAEEIQPRAIILDVMLPGIDGWELLGRLREHPATRAIPVIVCSILPRQDLALSLGAAGFLSKPVRRQELLAALAQLAPVEH